MNICKNRFARSVVVSALLLCSGLSLQAGTVVILDDSFESPHVPDKTIGDWSELYYINPDGWSRESPRHYIENETNTNIANRVNTPYGEQYMSLWISSGIVTTNITDALQAGVTYTLTFHVGNKNGDGNPDPTGSDYLAEILAGTNVVASTTGTTDTLDFSQQAVVTLTTDGSHPHLGKILGVRIAHNGPAYQYKTLVDNVKLVADESASEYKHTIHIGR